MYHACFIREGRLDTAKLADLERLGWVMLSGLILERVGLVPLHWLILESVGLVPSSRPIFEKGRLGTVELADFWNG